jgi:hypothetical protein
MIGTVLNLGSFLLDFASKLYPDSKDIGSAASVAERAKHSYNVVSTTSVHQSANRAIIAPMTAIEAPLLHQEFMGDLMQVIMLRDIVATLTHLSLQNSVGMGVKVENIIGTINPNRGGLLSVMGAEALDDNIKLVTGNEAADPKDKGDEKEPIPANTVQIGGKTFPDLNEYTPLAIGKVVLATIYGEAGAKQEFPLTFRQIPVPIQGKDLTRVFTAARGEDGFFARLLMLKTGEITGPEFLGGKDIIKERFKIKNEDMSGYYKEAMNRETGNKMAALRTGLVSFNNLANAFVMNKDTSTQLELDIGKRFGDATSREHIFRAVKANTIVVCNEDRGVFTFYTHGNDMPEVYTRRDLAIKSKKDTGSNTLADLVKLLNGGM